MTKEVIIPDGTDEEREIYLKLIKKFGLKVAKTNDPIPGATKVIKGSSYCSLCECTTVQYILMQKYTNGTWKKVKDITEEEVSKVSKLDNHKDYVTCCPNCITYLMEKDKMELVKMIMQSSSPALHNKAVKRVLKDMRGKSNGNNS